MNIDFTDEEDDKHLDMNDFTDDEDDQNLQPDTPVDNDNQKLGLAASVTPTATPLASVTQLSTSQIHSKTLTSPHKLFDLMKVAVDTDRTDVTHWVCLYHS